MINLLPLIFKTAFIRKKLTQIFLMFGRLTLFLKTGISFFLRHLLKTLGEFLFNIMIVLVLSFNLGPRRLNCLNENLNEVYICRSNGAFLCGQRGRGGGGLCYILRCLKTDCVKL